MRRTADVYDAAERWAAFPTTDLERLAHHPGPELRVMLADVRDELIDEISRRKGNRQDANVFDGT